MVSILQLPEVEARIRAADARPPSLDVLRQCVETIAAATGKNVKLQQSGSALLIRNDDQVSYTVMVRPDAYYGSVSSRGDTNQFTTKSVELLAWRACGFMFTPDQMRAAKERARSKGITGDRIPVNFFRSPENEKR
jgi:hypothetical protein